MGVGGAGVYVCVDVCEGAGGLVNKPHCFVKRICLISNFQTGRLYSASWQRMQVFSFRFT